jgi:anti-anti-sigma factor
MCHSGLRVLPPETPYLIPAGSGPPSGPDDALTLVVRHQPKYVLVTAVGEIDMATVAQWRERLRVLAASGRPVVADLDQVSFMDAAGLGILAGAAGLAAEHGGRPHVVCQRSSWPDPLGCIPGGPRPGHKLLTEREVRRR